MIRHAPIVQPGAIVAFDFHPPVLAVFAGGFFYSLVRHPRTTPLRSVVIASIEVRMRRSGRVFMCVSLLSGCADGSSVGRPFPTIPVFVERKVEQVIVYTWPTTVQVGDSLSVSTDSFDAAGHGTGARLTVAWTFSDETLIARTVANSSGRRVLLRGLRPGLLRVSATIAEKSGSDTVRVIPPLAPLRVEPAFLTLRRGDSAKVRLIVRDIDGVPVDNLVVFWETRDYTLVNAGCCRDTLTVRLPITGGSGTTQLVAKAANLSVALPITVTP